MDETELTEAAFDAALARAGIALAAEDRAVAFAEAVELRRAAAVLRAYVADPDRPIRR